MGRLESPDCYFRSISVDLQKKRDYIAKILTEAGMDPVVPEGGYFIMANWSKLGEYFEFYIKCIKQTSVRSCNCSFKHLLLINDVTYFSRQNRFEF